MSIFWSTGAESWKAPGGGVVFRFVKEPRCRIEGGECRTEWTWKVGWACSVSGFVSASEFGVAGEEGTSVMVPMSLGWPPPWAWKIVLGVLRM